MKNIILYFCIISIGIANAEPIKSNISARNIFTQEETNKE